MFANGKLVTCACLARMHLQVPAPATNIPTDEQFFSKTKKDMPDIAYLKNHFYKEGRIKEEHALYIIEEATKVLHTEPNLLDVDAPVTGQFFLSPLPMIMARVTYASVFWWLIEPYHSLRRYSWPIRMPWAVTVLPTLITDRANSMT